MQKKASEHKGSDEKYPMLKSGLLAYAVNSR